jgi:hypothetical protein
MTRDGARVSVVTAAGRLPDYKTNDPVFVKILAMSRLAIY